MASFYEVITRAFAPYRYFFIVLILLLFFAAVAIYAYRRFYSPTKPFDDVANADIRGQPCQIYMFHADWCPHCKTAKPHWKAFREEYDGRKINDCQIECIDVNCTDRPDTDPIISQFSIKGYPTIIMMRGDTRIDYDAKITKASLENFVEMATKGD